MNLQPLYDIKDRLEYAAIAGTSLLGENFRLKRAAEGLKPLAAASPVFAKIDAGLDKLLAAPQEERAGLLLDVLALTDAVAYTQAKAGAEGDLESLPAGSGVYQKISYEQIAPLLTALTTTGSGRIDVIQSAWENHPEWFADFRVLPVVAADLGDSYGEISELNTKILKQAGPAALPVLKEGFDPAGKKEMARRVEVISAIEGANASPWLREVLPEAKKDVRAAVLTALGGDPESAALLLELAQTERGGSREAVLEALAKQDGSEVREFWHTETGKSPDSIKYLRSSRTDWASDLVAAALRERLEAMFAKGNLASTQDRLKLEGARHACMGKTSPSMLDCWRWMDDHLNNGEQMRSVSGQLLNLSGETAYWLLDSLCLAGPGPLCDLCLELWERHRGQTRYLPHALVAALLTRPAAEVFDEFSSYIPSPQSEVQEQIFHDAVLRGLARLTRDEDTYLVGNTYPTAQPLDKRWFLLFTQARWRSAERSSPYAYWESVDGLDMMLMRLADTEDKETRQLLIPYLRQRMAEKGNPHTYSRWLFELGGSPKGVLGQAMAKNPDGGRLRVMWDLMNEAAKVLPGEEVADLLEEAFDAKGFYKGAWADANRIVPKTAALLRAGEPFPTWEEWTKM